MEWRNTIPTATTDPKIPPPERNNGVVSLYQCIKSVRNPIGLTRTLGLFRMTGYCTGNSSVVFEVLTDDGRHLGLKCYTRPKEHLDVVYGDALLREELYVFTGDGGVWIDVVALDWVEGCTLGETIRTLAEAGDTAALAALAARFDRMALDMLARDWAHGDLKPDNIIVTPDGSLRLIDFDAVYTPRLQHCRSCELGTAAWQHPSRSLADYDRHLDDYPIALISTLLHSLSIDPAGLMRYTNADEMPLDSRRIAAGCSEALEYAERLFAERCMAAQYRVAGLLRSRAYILPQLVEYLEYGVSSAECPATICGDSAANLCRNLCGSCGERPELTMRGGLYGYECCGRMLLPPLFDDVTGFRDGVAEVVLGGMEHKLNVKCVKTEH